MNNKIEKAEEESQVLQILELSDINSKIVMYIISSHSPCLNILSDN